MDNHIELKDIFKIDDSHSKIRGFVICRDEETGKILFKKENMIVKTGREILLRALFPESDPEPGDPVSPQFFTVSGSEYKMTEPTDDVNTNDALYKTFGVSTSIGIKGFGTNKNEPFLRNRVSEASLVEGQYYVNYTDLYIHFKYKRDGGGNGGSSVTSSFGLVVKNSDTTGEGSNNTGYTLFSRVTFPSYPDSHNLIFDYYIYF